MAAPRPMTTPTKPRVLCVDDEPGVLRSLEALLRGRFDVSSAPVKAWR